MSDDPDCLTAIDRAFRATLEAALVPGVVKRILGPEDVGPDRPLPFRFIPCVIVGIGDIDPTYVEAEAGGDRVLEERAQVDVMCVSDAGEGDFELKSRALMFAVRAAIAAAGRMGLPLDDVRLVGAKAQSFATEKGLGGGHHLAFAATFMTREEEPGVFIPTN